MKNKYRKSYSAWKQVCKKHADLLALVYPDSILHQRISGDKDIAEYHLSFNPEFKYRDKDKLTLQCIGEWDGLEGVIYCDDLTITP